jgi:hypothetical protein
MLRAQQAGKLEAGALFARNTTGAPRFVWLDLKKERLRE